MSNLLKYTVPTWDDHVYGHNNRTLKIKTSDSVIRIFGMLSEDPNNEELINKIIIGNTITVSLSDLNRFNGGANLNLETVYNTWIKMEKENNAPHVVLGISHKQTYCAWINSWSNLNTMTLSGISYYIPENRLWYLTQTQGTSSLLALSMLNDVAYVWMWKDNIEHINTVPTGDTLVTDRYNLNPVPVANQDNLFYFDNWTKGSILISLNNHPAYNLFDAEVSDPVLSSTGFRWVPRTSSTGETCTLAADQWTQIHQCVVANDHQVVEYKTAPYHPVSKMMDTNYKGVYTTSKKDTIFINGGSYKPTSLLKYTDKLLRKD